MQNFRFLGVLILVVLFVALACNFPTGAAPTRPPTPIPLSTEEIREFEKEIVATLANPEPSGDVTITITDQQINAYVAAQSAANPDEMIRDPQVHFAEGQVEVYAKITQGPLTSDAQIVLVPRVETGRPKLDVKSITIGVLPVPDALVEQVDQRVDSLLEDYLASIGENFTVNSIIITEGAMTISGVRQ